MERFRREGDYWTVAYRGTVSRVADVKGMRYLARLLAEPGREFHALDLASAEAPGPPRGAGDGLTVGRMAGAGPVLDAEAKHAYRRRISELRHEVEEAQRFTDPERAAKARAELEALTEHLAAAMGLGGRDRPVADAAERARLSVTKALRAALRRLGRHDPVLGGHLDATVHTGTYCSYRPDPERSPRWRVEASPRDLRPAAVPGAVVLPSDTPLIGREHERSRLRGLLSAALDGHGAFVVVSGEPGVGKTRLAAELVSEAADRGMAWAVGRCTDASDALPYLPIAQAVEAAAAVMADEDVAEALADSPGLLRLWPGVRRRAPDIPEPPPAAPAVERQAVLEAVVTFLARAAGERGLCVVLDDLQWADAATLRCLEHLAPQLTSLPVLLIGTARLEGLDVGRALARTRERLMRAHAWSSVALEPLSGEAVAALLFALDGRPPPSALVDGFVRQTGGNPFFVEELYRHLDERGLLGDAGHAWPATLGALDAAVPETVQLVIGHRLTGLGQAARRVVEAAAVLGRSAALTVVGRMVGLPDDALVAAVEEAERARLVVLAAHDEDDRAVFPHDLVRHAVLAGLSAPRRRRLHLRAAEALNSSDVRLAPTAELAHHLLAAGTLAQPAQVVAALHDAGRDALVAAAFDDAYRHLDRALSRCPDTELVTRVGLLADRGRAARALGRIDDAVGDWSQALAHAEHLGDGARVADLALEIGRSLDPLGRWREAEEVARRALAVAGEGDPARSRLLALAGRSAALQGRFTAAAGLLDDALEAAKDDDRQTGHVRHARAVHAFTRMAMRSAAAEMRTAAALLRRAGEPWEAAQAATAEHFCLLCCGRLGDADALSGSVLETTRRVGHLAAQAIATRTTAVSALLRSGDLEAFAAYAAEALERLTSLGVRFVADAHVDVGMAAFWRGDWDTARRHLRAAADAEPPGAYTGRYQGPLLLLDASSGRVEAVRRRWETHRRQRAQRPRASLGDRAMAAAGAEVWAALGDAAMGAACYDDVAGALADGVVIGLPDQRLLESCAGVAAAAAGRWEAAETHFARAVEQARALPHRLGQPETRRLWAQALLRRGSADDTRRARRLLEEARRGYGELGMPRHAALTDRLLIDPVDP